MIVNATELKNNLGKYLRICEGEDVIIKSNGKMIAKLIRYEEPYATPETDVWLLKEQSEAYSLKPRKVTYEEFLEISENSEERYEYIDGEIYLMASPKTNHQYILGEMYYIFASWFRGKNCRPMLSPYDITLKRNEKNINIVQPDLMVICDLDEKLNDKGYYMGVPVLMVEILSESTRGKDSVKKMDLYMSTGVLEYWIVNPWSKEITIHFFNNSDLVKSIHYKKDETAASELFNGLEVKLNDIFGNYI